VIRQFVAVGIDVQVVSNGVARVVVGSVRSATLFVERCSSRSSTDGDGRATADNRRTIAGNRSVIAYNRTKSAENGI
jgi:hypothetical protein